MGVLYFVLSDVWVSCTFIAGAFGSYKDSVGVLVDTWEYLSADYADLENYADLERMELDCLTGEVIGCAMKVHPLPGCGFLEIVELERKN